MDEERENETYDEEKYFSIDDFAYVCDDLTQHNKGCVLRFIQI